MIQILITDDHYAIRAGTALILQTEIKNLHIDQSSSYSDTITKVKNKDYDLLLLDIDMPDTILKRMMPELKAIKPDLKILIYTSYTDSDIIIQYIREGADGYLNKQAEGEEIINTVRNMLKYGYSYPPELAGVIARSFRRKNPIEELSEREMQIFNLLTEGIGNLEISNLLKIKTTTTSTYKRRIFEKLDVNSIFDLMKIKKKLH